VQRFSVLNGPNQLSQNPKLLDAGDGNLSSGYTTQP